MNDMPRLRTTKLAFDLFTNGTMRVSATYRPIVVMPPKDQKVPGAERESAVYELTREEVDKLRDLLTAALYP